MIREIDPYNAHKTFRFNLIAKEKEVEVEEFRQRDDTILLGFILLFFVAVAFVFLALVDTFFVQSRLDSINNSIKVSQGQLNSINSLVQSHGELISKATLLETAIQKDISFDKLFDIVENIFANKPLNLNSYERTVSGSFLINFSHDSVEQIDDLIPEFLQNELIEKAVVNRTSRLSDIGFQTQIEVKLK